MTYPLAFTHGLWKQSATDLRCWSWIGKGREGRGMVACVWICRLGELWVVAEAFTLEWKGWSRWGCRCACPNLVMAEVLARTAGTRTKLQMVHINDGYLSHVYAHPTASPALLWWSPKWGGAVMANREAWWPLFCLMEWVGVGEAMNSREERGAGRWHARHMEMGRGVVCSRSVTWNRVLRSEMVKVAEMGESREDMCVVRLIRGGGHYNWPLPQLFTAVNSSYWAIK